MKGLLCFTKTYLSNANIWKWIEFKGQRVIILQTGHLSTLFSCCLHVDCSLLNKTNGCKNGRTEDRGVLITQWIENFCSQKHCSSQISQRQAGHFIWWNRININYCPFRTALVTGETCENENLGRLKLPDFANREVTQHSEDAIDVLFIECFHPPEFHVLQVSADMFLACELPLPQCVCVLFPTWMSFV